MAPNSDPGNDAIVSEINAFVARCARVRAFTFLERCAFVNLLRHASALVGNSSAGILEAPSLGLPVVNIGMRQRGREHADNVIFTDYEPDEIAAAISRATGDPAFRARVAERRTPYGDGRAGRRIADVLAGVEMDQRLMRKAFVMEDAGC